MDGKETAQPPSMDWGKFIVMGIIAALLGAAISGAATFMKSTNDMSNLQGTVDAALAGMADRLNAQRSDINILRGTELPQIRSTVGEIRQAQNDLKLEFVEGIQDRIGEVSDQQRAAEEARIRRFDNLGESINAAATKVEILTTNMSALTAGLTKLQQQFEQVYFTRSPPNPPPNGWGPSDRFPESPSRR